MPTAPPSQDAAARGPGLRRLWIGLGSTALLLVVLRIVLPYAIPPLASWQIMRQLGLDARIANVDLDLFGGGVALDGVWIGLPNRAAEPFDPTAALLALDRITLDLSWLELLGGRIHLQTVEVSSPRVLVERQADGTLDPLHDVAGTDPDPEADGVDDGWPVRVDDLVLRGAEVRLVEAGDGEELLDFQLAELELRAFSLDGHALGLGGIQIREPRVRANRDFLLDPTKAAGRPPEPPAEAAPEAPGEPRSEQGYRIDELAIERAGFSLRLQEHVIDMALALRAEGVTLDRGSTFPLEVTVEVEEAGRLEVKGETGLSPPSFDGTVTLHSLPLRLTLIALREDLSDWIERIVVDAELDVAFHTVAHGESPPGLATNGHVALRALDLSDPQDDALALSWDALELVLHEVSVPTGEAAETTPARVHLTSVRLDAPKLRYHHPTDAAQRLVRGPAASSTPAGGEAAPASKAQAAAPEPEIRVDLLEIAGGVVHVRDTSVTPPFEVVVAKLEASARDVDVGAPSVRQVDIDLAMDDGSRVTIDGTIGAQDGEVALNVVRLQLQPVNSYTRSAGIAVTDGELTLATQARVQNRHWKIENDLTLHHLRIDEAASAAFLDRLDVPIGVVLPLLRDPSGDIDLPVSLEFDEGKMNTGVMELITAAVRQALVGAATLPLKALGGLVRSDGRVSLDPVAMEPGDAPNGLTAEQARPIGSLLKKRPGLAVRLVGRAGEADRSYLQRALLAERVAAGSGLPKIDEGAGPLARRKLENALEERTRGGAPDLSGDDEARLERYAATIDVPEERYAALARARAEQLRTLLVEDLGVETSRVRVGHATQRGEPGVVLDLQPFEPSLE